MKNKIISILFLGAGLFLSGCNGSDVKVISSDGSKTIDTCKDLNSYWYANAFGECLLKACPNGFDVVANSGGDPIFKCKP
jgi:hypothetical protein